MARRSGLILPAGGHARPALLLAAALAMVAACSEEPTRTAPSRLPPPPTHSHDFVDQNADAYVDLSEWHGHGDRAFEKLDIDASGTLTQEEIIEGFDVFDVDGSGVLEAHEVDAAILDANEDGIITREEWQKNRLERFVDRNADGEIDREEMRAHRFGTFDAADTNSDSRVAAIELSPTSPRFPLFRF